MNERTYVRSEGRSDGSDVITKPKFLALMGLPKKLWGSARGAPSQEDQNLLLCLKTKFLECLFY